MSTYKSMILRKKKGRKAAPPESANGAAMAQAVKAPKHAAGSISDQVAMLKAASAALGKEEAEKTIDLQ